MDGLSEKYNKNDFVLPVEFSPAGLILASEHHQESVCLFWLLVLTMLPVVLN